MIELRAITMGMAVYRAEDVEVKDEDDVEVDENVEVDTIITKQ